MAQEDVGQEAEGQERTRDQVEPSKVCHALQLGPASQFPKLPQIAPPPGDQAFNTWDCR